MTRAERYRVAQEGIRAAATRQGIDPATGLPIDARTSKQRRLDQHAAMMRAARLFSGDKNLPKSLENGHGKR